MRSKKASKNTVRVFYALPPNSMVTPPKSWNQYLTTGSWKGRGRERHGRNETASIPRGLDQDWGDEWVRAWLPNVYGFLKSAFSEHRIAGTQRHCHSHYLELGTDNMELFFTAISEFPALKRKGLSRGRWTCDGQRSLLQLGTALLTHPNGRKDEMTFLPSVCKTHFWLCWAIWEPSDAIITGWLVKHHNRAN